MAREPVRVHPQLAYEMLDALDQLEVLQRYISTITAQIPKGCIIQRSWHHPHILQPPLYRINCTALLPCDTHLVYPVLILQSLCEPYCDPEAVLLHINPDVCPAQSLAKKKQKEQTQQTNNCIA